MLRQTLYLLTTLLIVSCQETRNQDKETETHTQELENSIKSIKNLDSLRFDFSAYRIKEPNLFVSLKIKCSIYNDKSDTVYFLTTSCHGELNSLRYDTAKFELVS